MRYRNVAVEGGHRSGHGGGGVALDDSHIERMFGEQRVECGEGASGDLGERLTGGHQVEVEVGSDLKAGEHLIEHGAMLRGNADLHLEFGVG